MTEGDRRLRVLSAFTGAGGLDLGLEAAGFDVAGCIECDELAKRTLRANRTWPVLEPGDIETVAARLQPEDLGLQRGDLAVLAGGPPCQPFSKAAQWSANGRAGMRDARSRCVLDLLDLVDRFLPEVILLENVAGFVRTRGALDVIRVALESINGREGTEYTVSTEILDAVDYGVPQRRQRAIIVATRSGTSFVWPAATHVQAPVRAWDAIGHVPLDEPPPLVGKWAKLLPSIPEGANYLWHTDHGGGRPLFGYRTRYWSFLLKLAKAEPAWTLSAQPGPATGPFHWDNRPLTVPEMLRLQTFPDGWTVVGNYREQVRQIGNATPPLLAEIIARELAKQVFKRTYKMPPGHSINRAKSVPPPRQAVDVPRRYRALEGSHPAHPGTGRGPRPIASAAYAVA